MQQSALHCGIGYLSSSFTQEFSPSNANVRSPVNFKPWLWKENAPLYSQSRKFLPLKPLFYDQISRQIRLEYLQARLHLLSLFAVRKG